MRPYFLGMGWQHGTATSTSKPHMTWASWTTIHPARHSFQHPEVPWFLTLTMHENAPPSLAGLAKDYTGRFHICAENIFPTKYVLNPKVWTETNKEKIAIPRGKGRESAWFPPFEDVKGIFAYPVGSCGGGHIFSFRRLQDSYIHPRL